MGMLKRMKDMKDMVNAAPGMVAQAQELGAQAQQMAAARQAALAAQQQAAYGAPTAMAAGADFSPIADVTLEQFTAVSKGVAAFGYDQARLPEIAATHGIPAAAWAAASAGWNDRIKASPAVAQRFNQLYRQG
jgi:hypothetical protein